jgi:predicted regulator of Ras-like GTPase activity (Roadblock/LC7/MglB family)
MNKLGLSVTPLQVQQMDRILSVLVEDTPAQFALVIDQSGSVVSSMGENLTSDLAVLGTLIAGDLSASQEIARLTGQYQKYQLIIREGDLTNSILAEAGEHLILYLQISKSSPLGWVRLRVLEACRELKEFVFLPGNEFGLDLDLNTSGSKSISDLTDDALDSMWIN